MYLPTAVQVLTVQGTEKLIKVYQFSFQRVPSILNNYALSSVNGIRRLEIIVGNNSRLIRMQVRVLPKAPLMNSRFRIDQAGRTYLC